MSWVSGWLHRLLPLSRRVRLDALVEARRRALEDHQAWCYVCSRRLLPQCSAALRLQDDLERAVIAATKEA